MVVLLGICCRLVFPPCPLRGFYALGQTPNSRKRYPNEPKRQQYLVAIKHNTILRFYSTFYTSVGIPGLGMWHVWVRRGRCIGSWWGNRREGDHWGDLGIHGWIILGWISRRCDVGILTG